MPESAKIRITKFFENTNSSHFPKSEKVRNNSKLEKSALPDLEKSCRKLEEKNTNRSQKDLYAPDGPAEGKASQRPQDTGSPQWSPPLQIQNQEY